MTQATHLHSRAEVVGYSEPVLEAVRDLVHEIQADPVLALVTGQSMITMREVFAVAGTDGRKSGLYEALAQLVLAAAEAAEGTDQ
jgi:hypothetical protein